MDEVDEKARTGNKKMDFVTCLIKNYEKIRNLIINS